MKKMEYVLVTPARNEQDHIEKTIQSVLSQTLLPKKWIIVSDGSIDRTDDIVKRYSNNLNWIDLFRMPEYKKHNFASKVYCFNSGYALIKNLNFDIIANLDADISFDKDHFEFLLEKFEKDPCLGVAGTRYIESGEMKNSYSFIDVAGQCQVFRRKCFEDIGGYTPLKYGGIDWVATTMARMKGWKTITYDDKYFIHHRVMGTAPRNSLEACIHFGREDYLKGNHPLWELFRVLYQTTQKPYLIGGLLLLFGYVRSYITRLDRQITDDVIIFHRKEQMKRLYNIAKNILKLNFKFGET